MMVRLPLVLIRIINDFDGQNCAKLANEIFLSPYEVILIVLYVAVMLQYGYANEYMCEGK